MRRAPARLYDSTLHRVRRRTPEDIHRQTGPQARQSRTELRTEDQPTNQALPDSATITAALQGFIQEDLLYDREDLILDEQTQLLQERLVDSMGIFRLIDFIEQEFGLAIQPSEIQVEHFQSIASIRTLIEQQGRSA